MKIAKLSFIVCFEHRYEDPEVFRQAKTILLEMGHFFQVQDDFLDCFGNPDVTGKIGTDIQDNKCTWLAVLCMQRATEAQKQIMRDCYGKNGKFLLYLSSFVKIQAHRINWHLSDAVIFVLFCYFQTKNASIGLNNCMMTWEFHTLTAYTKRNHTI